MYGSNLSSTNGFEMVEITNTENVLMSIGVKSLWNLMKNPFLMVTAQFQESVTLSIAGHWTMCLVGKTHCAMSTTMLIHVLPLVYVSNYQIERPCVMWLHSSPSITFSHCTHHPLYPLPLFKHVITTDLNCSLLSLIDF